MSSKKQATIVEESIQQSIKKPATNVEESIQELSAIEKKKMIQFYFVIHGKGLYGCKQHKCRNKSYKSLNGYGNLYKHLVTCVGQDFVQKYNDAKKSDDRIQQTSIEQFITADVTHCHAWIQYIVMTDKPISDVDNPYVRALGKSHGKVCSTTMTHNILCLSDVVREIIEKKLPDKFVIVFDGWTSGTTHFTAVLACYLEPMAEGTATKKEKKADFQEVVLAIQPFFDERELNANQQVELLT